jgi:5'-deoxynucleotidase YfbR-like HD superfamily hydrolase
MYHDVTEAVRGDPPAPALWRSEHVRKGYADLDLKIETDFALPRFELTEWEKQVLSFCDSMEFGMYALEEVASGNQIFLPRARAVIDKIRERKTHEVTPAATSLHTLMHERVRQYETFYGHLETPTHDYPC